MGVALLVALLITIHCVKGLQWHSVQSARLVGSIFSENVLSVTQTQCSTHVKRVSQRFAESCGFSPGTPVSFHREC